jgi:hypothetical protein
MKFTTAVAITLFLLCPATATFAQTIAHANALPVAPEASASAGTSAPALSDRLFETGDQTINLAIGTQIPLFVFGGDATSMTANFYTGASFSLSYQYYILHGLAVGATVSGSYNQTVGGRSLFVAPLSLRTAYWWSLDPFEFCVAVEAGGYISIVNPAGMIGPFAKAGGGVYWRVSNSWSIGVQPYYWFIPEIHTSSYANLTRFGNVLEVSAAAYYHL